jgi:iron complex outermembrane receptor protein
LREGTLAAGHSLGKSSAITASGLITHLDGRDLYYPEFDAPQTNSGVAHGLDWERAVGGLGALTVGDFVARVGYVSRAKGVPTAAFDGAFNDPRAQTVDETFWGSVAGSRDFAGSAHLTGRLYADRYRYRGVYPADAGPAYSDGGGSTDVGGEGLLVWEVTSRHRLTLGSELRRVLRADYYEQFADGAITRDDEPANTASVFSQDEYQLSDALTFVGGLRWDWNSRHSGAFSPRLAVIYTPTSATTIKALYGEAFRAPSTAEADITTTYYTRNPALTPERIRTLELTVEHRLSSPLLASGSLYGYHVLDLIDQVVLPDASVEYRNVAKAEGAGAEVELDFRPAGPVAAHASYALQHANAEPGNERLANSPEQIGILSLTTRRSRGVQLTGLTRYESGRRTLSGPSTPAFIRTDAHVSWSPAALSGAEVGLRVTNLFGVHYATPGGPEHRQSAIAQDGRAWSLRLTWRF